MPDVVSRLAGLSLLLGPAVALACTCFLVPLEEEYRNATFIFEGLVLTGNGDMGDAEFEVLRVWKGNPPKRVRVGSRMGCPAVVNAGEKRLMFLGPDPDVAVLSFWGCSRHALIGSGQYQEDVEGLARLTGQRTDSGVVLERKDAGIR